MKKYKTERANTERIAVTTLAHFVRLISSPLQPLSVLFSHSFVVRGVAVV